MPATLVAAVLAALYLLLDPPSADLAAHVYRAGLVDRAGWVVWDNGWYGGHHLPGYSVLFPPLGALAGVRLVGALSVVAATAAFGRLTRSAPAACWFAVAMAATVVSGRLPFALGAATGLWALAAAARGRVPAAAALAVLTTLCSPVAGLFLGLAGVAWARSGGGRRRAALAVTAGSGLTLALLVVLFPEGGSEPFAASSFWPALAATAAGLAIAPRGPLRAGLVLYGALLVAAFAVATPLGGNAARLGGLLAGPLAALILWPARRGVLALAAVPLAYWTLYPPVRDWGAAAGDPAVAAAYYAPLLAELRRAAAGAPPARLEIPFTARHWEAARVAPAIPLARGWERQLDRRDNAVLYSGGLTAARYRAWVEETAVRWVALPDAALDRSARAEAGLIAAGLPWLHEIWRSAHWRLFEVAHPAPLGVSRLGTDGFTTAGGLVRVRWTPYWALLEGHGCVRRGAGGWTLVVPRGPASPLRVGIRFAPWRAVAGGGRCR